MYLGKSSAKKYDMPVIGEADDHSDANGISILTYDQAQAKAREMRSRRVTIATGGVEGPYTVRRAIEDYCEFLKDHGKDHKGPQTRANALILPTLGDIEVAALTTEQLRKWLVGVANSPARLRTRAGKPQKYREKATDEATKRPRKATANRTFTILKAALNRAWRDGKVASDTAWRRVDPFHSTDAARVEYLAIDEPKRLLNASPTDFRKLVSGALVTGARYGQLAKMVAADFNPTSRSVTLRSRKGKGKLKTYTASLNEEGVKFFAQAVVGLAPTDLIFKKADGTPWEKSQQSRPMADACAAAKIKPVGFHQLRHTWASHAVMNGVPLLVVAKNLGHSDTRIVERHYGHLAPSYIADAIRAGAPTFGIATTSNVKELRRGG
ncbi:MAG: tyrosine-type recombinase/integrase [Xanthobacteraceae bacterium]